MQVLEKYNLSKISRRYVKIKKMLLDSRGFVLNMHSSLSDFKSPLYGRKKTVVKRKITKGT